MRYVVPALGLLFLLSACGELLPGACEFHSQSTGTYGCYDESKSSCNITEDVYGSAYFHSGTSCRDIGYDISSPYSYSYASADGKSPSSEGYYSGGGSTADTTDESGTGGSVDLEVQCAIERVWSGDPNDQFAYHCQLACAYRAEGHIQEAESTCDILRTADQNHGFNTVSQCSSCN